MSAELLLQNFERLGYSPEAIAKLRQFLLALAVQGQLLPQNTTDTEPKPLLDALAGPTHEHHEPEKSLQRFTIPASWCWATVSDIFDHQLGKMLNSSKMKGVERRYLRSVNIRKDGSIALTDLNQMLLPEIELGKYSVQHGDVFVIEGGDVGRNAMWLDQSTEPLAFQNQLHRLRVRSPFNGRFFQLTIEHARQSGLLLDLAAGVTIKHLSATSLRSLPIPVPPVEEQYRIAAKFDELMFLCDQLEEAQKERETRRAELRSSSLNRLVATDLEDRTTFDIQFFLDTSPRSITHPKHISSLRQAILELAAKGRLVPQYPVNKSVLLDSQRDDRVRTIKADELPYTIPSNWTWVRLGSFAQLINGDRSKQNYPNRSEYVSEGVPWINTGHITPNGGLSKSAMHHITMAKFESLRSGKTQEGDLVYCLRGATIGKTGVIEKWSEGAIASSLVIIRIHSDSAIPLFIRNYLVGPVGRQLIKRFDNGSAQPNLAANSVRNYVVPLPPIEEQVRIVSKVNDLMNVCDALENAFSSSQHEGARLVDSLLHELLHGFERTPAPSREFQF